MLVSKVISGPDLADPSGILWMSLGVLAFAGQQLRAEQARDERPTLITQEHDFLTSGPRRQNR
jgi:hypothetical protein